MAIGICFHNFRERDGLLTESRHSLVARASDGAVLRKGTSTGLLLRPFKEGDILRLTIDMQARELTFELLASGEADGNTRNSAAVTVERLPNEVVVAVGFPGSSESDASPQRVKILSCSSERPVRACRREAWDHDDNIQPPLHQRPTYTNLFSWRDRAPVHCALEEASVASSLT